MLIQKSVVKSVTVSELKAGDRLLVDLLGYKDRVVYNQGKVLNNRDISWFREKLKEPKPKLASERYQTGKRAVAPIRNMAGVVLVKAGDALTADALTPLLKEGFDMVDGMDAGVKLFVRKTEWPEDRMWRIDQFNPTIKIETVVTINDEIQDEPEDTTVPPEKKKRGRPSFA